MDWANATARRDVKDLCLGERCVLYQRIDCALHVIGFLQVDFTHGSNGDIAEPNQNTGKP